MARKTPALRLASLPDGGFNVQGIVNRNGDAVALDKLGALRLFGADIARPYVDPRDYTFQGYMMEQSAANYFRHSGDLTQSEWVKSADVTRATPSELSKANFPSINGDLAARGIFRVALTSGFTAGQSQGFRQTVTTLGTGGKSGRTPTILPSFYVKADDLKMVGVQVKVTDSGSKGSYTTTSYFDLTTGRCYRQDRQFTMPSSETMLRAHVPVCTPYGNGWFRLSVAQIIGFAPDAAIEVGLVNDPQDAGAAAGKDFFVAWPQFESPISGLVDRHFPASYVESGSVGRAMATETVELRPVPRLMRGGTYVFRGAVKREVIMSARPMGFGKDGFGLNGVPDATYDFNGQVSRLFDVTFKNGQGGDVFGIRVNAAAVVVDAEPGSQFLILTVVVNNDITVDGGSTENIVPMAVQPITVPIRVDSDGAIQDVDIAVRHNRNSISLFVNGERTALYNVPFATGKQPISYVSNVASKLSVGYEVSPLVLRALDWYSDELPDRDIVDLTSVL